MNEKTGVSRRSFMRNAAVAAAAPAALTGAGAAHADTADILVAATVVRASHSRTTRGALTIGVRASVLADGFSGKDVVVIVEGVTFGASADETRTMITRTVQQRIAKIMAESGTEVQPEQVAVQVFGGVL